MIVDSRRYLSQSGLIAFIAAIYQKAASIFQILHSFLSVFVKIPVSIRWPFKLGANLFLLRLEKRIKHNVEIDIFVP